MPAKQHSKTSNPALVAALNAVAPRLYPWGGGSGKKPKTSPAPDRKTVADEEGNFQRQEICSVKQFQKDGSDTNNPARHSP